MRHSVPHILICGACYSNNLGDGVIADCLESLIHQTIPGCHIRRQDITGLQDYQTHPAHQTSRSLSRRYLPTPIRALAGWSKWRWRVRNNMLAINRPNMIVIGGGQLLMDNRWLFPLRLASLAAYAHRHEIPLAWHACGVGEKWSTMATRLIAGALNGSATRSISLRDRTSCNRLANKFNLPVQPSTTPDPAVWAANVYPQAAQIHRDKMIGLGVTSPDDLRRPVAHPEQFVPSRVFNFWVELACQLHAKGYIFALFTNGSPKDTLFAEEIANALSDRLGPVGHSWHTLPRATRPEQLAEQIAGFRAIVAHRLHANILAFAFNVPAVGLVWDTKVHSFAREVQRHHWVLPSDRLCSTSAATLVLQAMQQGSNNDVLVHAQQQALAGVEQMVAACLPEVTRGGI